MRFLRRGRRDARNDSSDSSSAGPELELAFAAPSGDDPYFAEIGVTLGRAHYAWAEVFLEGVEESAEGPARVQNARVVVRMYFDSKHVDFPYEDVVATLERARSELLSSESHVPPS
jgi:hypothetical protein